MNLFFIIVYKLVLIVSHISLATLKLSVFHDSLLATFEPIVDDYLTGLDNSITNDMKAFFDNETWIPVS